MTRNPAMYRKLFTSTFYLSAFTFGGGFVIIPLMKKKFVDELNWLEEEEMLNLAAIAQSSPGAVAVNAAILLGYRTGGPLGALTAILGTVLPPLIIITIISAFYAAFRSNPVVNAVLKGMQAGVAAVIADVVLSMGGKVVRQKKWLPTLTMAGAFLATWYFHINVVFIILACGAIGGLMVWLESRREKRGEEK